MSAYIIPPVNADAISARTTRFGITDAMLEYSSVPEVPPPAYNAATVYAKDAEASTGVVGGVISVWRSKQAGNVGHPLVEGDWWTWAGDTYAAWDPARNYAQGDMVVRATTHQVYKRATPGTTAQLPEEDATGVNWVRMYATNRWAMFDMLSTRPTRAPGPVVLRLKPGRITSVELLDVSDGNVAMSMDAYGEIVWPEFTVQLDTTPIADWEEYFFAPFAPVSNVVRLDAPTYADCVLNIRIEAGADFSIGWLLVGSAEYIGKTRQGPRVRDRPGGKINRAKSNEVEDIEVSGTVTQVSQTLWIDKPYVRRARDVLRVAGRCPCVIVGLDNQEDEYASLLTFVGLCIDSEIEPNGDAGSVINLQTESV